MTFADPDWLGLWRELVERATRYDADAERSRHRAHRLEKDKPDPLVETVCRMLGPEQTVVEIGPATGRWTLPLARVVRRVTAIDSSPVMIQRLRHNVAEAGLDNVDIRKGAWEETDLEPHDAVLGSHSMYAASDLAAFVLSMQRASRRYCFLSLRVTSPAGVMAELSRQVHGHSHDSANFVIGYNALLSLGIFPNVLIEPAVKRWADDSLDAALRRAKRHLHLSEADTRWDAAIHETLARRLFAQDGGLRWPDWMRSALMWWEVEPEMNVGRGPA